MSDQEREIIIAGVGMTPVREHWDLSLRDLAFEAMRGAQQDAGGLQPQALFVANMLAATLSGQSQLGALLADFAGLRGIEAHTVEAAGASAGTALRQAYLSIRAGEIDTALVVGVEKVSEHVSSEVEQALVSATDTDYEAVQGVTRTAQAALLMRRYLHEHDAPPDALAGFSLTAHANAVHNPNAMFRRALRKEVYGKAGMVSDPISIFDAAPMADGAAALLLTRSSLVPEPLPQPRVRIAGSAVATAPVALHDAADPLHLEAVSQATSSLYERTGRRPEDIDLFELHDIFTIYAALALEASGFSEPGGAWRLAQDGAIERSGPIPICTFGGSKARGDTAGSTGAYQLAEATLQLQGRAGENQVEGARVALVQCLGGNAATCASHLLERLDAEG